MHSKKRKLFLSACLMLTSAAFLSGCDETTENTGGTSQEIDTWYTVSLNPNGGTFSDGTTATKTIQVGENQPIDFSSYEVTYEGNVLYGWYYENGSPWPGARKVTEDVSLVAKWNVAEEEVEVGLDIWDENGTHLTIREDDGVYQFSRSSYIYYGYATRSATYTIRHDNLVDAIENTITDGKAQCVIHAESSYTDATGTCYAEFFNDGVVEIYYDYYYGDSRSKYCMESLYYSVEGVTFPYDAPDELINDGAGTSSHYADNDEALAGGPGCNTGGDDSGSEGGDEGGDEDESNLMQTYVEGDTIYTANATNSETMSAAFTDNGLVYIKYSGYNAGIVYEYSYSADEGLTITSDGTSVAVSEETEGTFTFSDSYSNIYSVDEATLAAAIPTAETLVDIAATNSDTMLLRLYDNHTYSVMYYYSDYAMYVEIGVNGTWNYDETNGVQFGGSSSTSLTLDGNGIYTYSDGMGNTYQFTSADITGITELMQTYVMGDAIYTADATNSDSMHAVFYDNGLISIQYYTYDAGLYYEYSYSADEGLTITSDGTSVSVSEDTEGTFTFSDSYYNTYSISETALAAAIPAASTLIDISATNSETMALRLYDNHTYSVMYYYSAYGMYVEIGVKGTWNYSEENGVQFGGSSSTSLTLDGNGTYTYSDGMGNTYQFTASDIVNALNSAA